MYTIFFRLKGNFLRPPSPTKKKRQILFVPGFCELFRQPLRTLDLERQNLGHPGIYSLCLAFTACGVHCLTVSHNNKKKIMSSNSKYTSLPESKSISANIFWAYELTKSISQGQYNAFKFSPNTFLTLIGFSFDLSQIFRNDSWCHPLTQTCSSVWVFLEQGLKSRF